MTKGNRPLAESAKPYLKTIGNVNLAQRRQTLARIHGGAVAFRASRRQEFSTTYWRTSRATVANYPNTGLKRNTTYRYRVRAFISADGFQIGFLLTPRVRAKSKIVDLAKLWRRHPNQVS